MRDLPREYSGSDLLIDASGKMVMPGFCDSHTHLVYAGSRETELIDRIKGMTYEEIAGKGGGILNSALLIHDTDEEEIYNQSAERIHEIMSHGTVAVEIKSGYGLNLEDELKMLRVIRKIKTTYPLTVKSTLLAAHALPREYRHDRQGYIDYIIKEMIPAVAGEELADYIDVFCDTGFFTPSETRAILIAGSRHGLRPKIHANELGFSGGVQVGVETNALSVDHLEFTSGEEIDMLLASNTIPAILPSASFFLGLKYAPARRIIDAGLPVALASDYNPGTSPSGNMLFVLALASIKLGMLPEEALNAMTINGAFAMGVDREHGTFTPGKIASFIIFRPVPGISYLPYAFTGDHIESVFIKGRKIR
jgi:imidazolonepropionase